MVSDGYKILCYETSEPFEVLPTYTRCHSGEYIGHLDPFKELGVKPKYRSNEMNRARNGNGIIIKQYIFAAQGEAFIVLNLLNNQQRGICRLHF
jgi:hypothetical protein